MTTNLMQIAAWTAEPVKRLAVFGNGRGGAHRDTREARLWRFTTTQVAQSIRAAYPEMGADIARSHAQDETAHAFHIYNAIKSGGTWPGYNR
jgi:hypothetical protein